MWPELLKAKTNLKNIEAQIDLLLRNHNSLTKKELAKQQDILLADVDASLQIIREELSEFAFNLRNHRNYIESKSRFVRRHYKRI